MLIIRKKSLRNGFNKCVLMDDLVLSKGKVSPFQKLVTNCVSISSSEKRPPNPSSFMGCSRFLVILFFVYLLYMVLLLTYMLLFHE